MIWFDGARAGAPRDERETVMRRRVAMAVRIAFVPIGAVMGVLLFAGPAQAAEAGGPVPGEAVVRLMPIIGSGTHPVAVAASWGVGNG